MCVHVCVWREKQKINKIYLSTQPREKDIHTSMHIFS